KASGEDTPLAVFPVPRIKFDGGADFTIDQDLNISCVECLSRLAKSAAENKDFSVLVTGDPDLKYGALPTAHLDIHKTLSMKGTLVWSYLQIAIVADCMQDIMSMVSKA